MSLNQTNKINSELEQIIHPVQQEMFNRRIQWANARGKRLEFIKELNERLKDLPGKRKGRVNERAKAYSTAMAAYDKENMNMGWN